MGPGWDKHAFPNLAGFYAQVEFMPMGSVVCGFMQGNFIRPNESTEGLSLDLLFTALINLDFLVFLNELFVPKSFIHIMLQLQDKPLGIY